MNNIILEFLGNNIFLVFDIVSNEEWKQYIDEYGKCIKGTLDQRLNFGCSLSLNKDITIIDVESGNPTSSECTSTIAIISDIEQCNSDRIY